MKLQYTIYTGQHLTVFHKGMMFDVQAKDKRFSKIEKLLLEGEHDQVLPLIQPELIFSKQKNLKFINDRIYFKDNLLPLGFANALFDGIVNEENIGRYLYIWEKFTEAVNNNRSEFWKFQANKLYYSVYPFEEYLLCLRNPSNEERVNIPNLIYLDSNNSVDMNKFFMKRLNLSEIMKELDISGDKLKKAIKSKLIKKDKIDSSILHFVSYFKDKIDVDSLIELINETPHTFYQFTHKLSSFVELWAKTDNVYNHKKIKKLYTQTPIYELSLLARVINDHPFWVNFILPNTNSILEIAQYIENEGLKLKFAQYNIDYSQEFPQLSNVNFNNHPEVKMIIPTEGMNLFRWGQQMSNCIGGERYMKVAHERKSLLLAFAIDNEIQFTLEIVDQELRQFDERKGVDKLKPIYEKIINKELLRCGILKPMVSGS